MLDSAFPSLRFVASGEEFLQAPPLRWPATRPRSPPLSPAEKDVSFRPSTTPIVQEPFTIINPIDDKMKANPINLFTLSILAVACLHFNLRASADSSVVASGKFEGRGGHKMSGGVSLLKTADGHVLKLAEDFSLDGAPAPRLGFGRNGYRKETQFSKLTRHKGAQTYTLPANLDPIHFNEVWVWCQKFDVPLGVARLN